MKNLVLLILLAALAGGSVAPFAKIAMETFQPFTLIVIRFLSTSLILLPFVLKNNELNIQSFKALRSVAVIGSLNPILLFLGLQFTLASVSPLIYAAVPLMTALYLYKVKNMHIAMDRILGILVGFMGVAIIILLPFFQNGRIDLRSVWGNILILGAALAFMVYGIVSKDQQQQNNTSALALTFYLSIVTVAVAIPFSIFELIHQPVILSTVQPKHILAALETGLIGTSLFYISYQKALKLGNELTASLFTYLQPISAILFSLLLLGEKLTPPFLVGGALAVIGAGMASRTSGKRRPLACGAANR